MGGKKRGGALCCVVVLLKEEKEDRNDDMEYQGQGRVKLRLVVVDRGGGVEEGRWGG